MNPFTMCLKCHKMVLAHKITFYKGKCMCEDCKRRLIEEERRNKQRGIHDGKRVC